ncbi:MULTISPECIES: hypothetical protein [unclassified Pedobacter]|uniref:hypothetical protein n=1 Tax=unclassified Pedobacter TaxID=2628915 RepID=UPI00141F5266|nr:MULTISPECIES: hypothetical protein [unclassified Pedobacter]NII81733.1 hypothetical protein [Pedobacter sp. SG908]NMN35737.1 hypothetical protein [Pedobacter sp. SG918]
MKTAEEILSNNGLACEYGYNVKVVPLEDAIKAMKLYANQKLDEAAEKVTHYDGFSEDNMDHWIDEKSILSLKDKV